MSGMLHHFALTAKTRTGFSVGIVVWAIVAAISIAATIIFFLIAGFIVIAQRYDTVIAGLALGGLLLRDRGRRCRGLSDDPPPQHRTRAARARIPQQRELVGPEPAGARTSDRACHRMASGRIHRRRRHSGGRAGKGADEPRSGPLQIRRRKLDR